MNPRGVGLDGFVIDRAKGVASAWRARYDGFRLNTSSWFSYLPGRRLPRDAGRWPSRDSLVRVTLDSLDLRAERKLQIVVAGIGFVVRDGARGGTRGVGLRDRHAGGVRRRRGHVALNPNAATRDSPRQRPFSE
jgi:hypothetical protein